MVGKCVFEDIMIKTKLKQVYKNYTTLTFFKLSSSLINQAWILNKFKSGKVIAKFVKSKLNVRRAKEIDETGKDFD